MIILRKVLSLIATCSCFVYGWGQSFKFKLVRPITYEESEVPTYLLPDLFLCNDGTIVEAPKQWEKKRRPEIMELFSKYMFGKVPKISEGMKAEIIQTNENARGGKAIRRDVRVYPLSDHPDFSVSVQIYLPLSARTKPVPLFFACALLPNYTVCNDKDIYMPDTIMHAEGRKIKAVKRGYMSEFWQLDKILERGYGLATFCHQDISPDTQPDFLKSIPYLYYSPGYNYPKPDEWGSISFWAWQMSRVLDYLVTDKLIDKKKIIAIGHSRFGKTVLWAAAQDQRYAMIISNNSGCGGASISRRQFGETIEAINQQFPQWFCGNFKQFNNREEFMPFDQHELLALIAPRPLYIASAEDDKWADPKGEFLSAKEASRVYNLYGLKGIDCNTMPLLNVPVNDGYVGYHYRKGKHTITSYDWDQFLNFADKFFK